MDESVRKKQREAEFFLQKLKEAQGSQTEKPDYYLSAFLSAARSIEYRCRKHHKVAFKAFWGGWTHTNKADYLVIKQMTNDRDMEVHSIGSGRVEGKERIEVPVGTSFTDASGTGFSYGPPGCPPLIMIRRGYFFRIDGKDIPVVERCGEYLAILGRILREFEGTLPS